MPPSACVVVHPAERYTGAQGASYLTGLTSESVGTTGICMTVLLLPVGARSRTHLHRSIESAAYVLEGELETRSGERLEHTIMARSGDLVYIPADLPHMVINAGSEPARALVVHTAADDQEGIVLLPDLDGGSSASSASCARSLVRRARARAGARSPASSASRRGGAGLGIRATRRRRTAASRRRSWRRSCASAGILRPRPATSARL